MDEGVILLVEDNPDDVLLTQRALRQHRIGNQVIVAGDGEEALEYLQPASAEGPCPALILLDINLPKVNGLQVLEVLSGSARTRRLPVIVLTNSSHERDMVESLNLGAHSYITKPVVVPDFGTPCTSSDCIGT